jgi:hypothetical protein
MLNANFVSFGHGTVIYGMQNAAAFMMGADRKRWRYPYHPLHHVNYLTKDLADIPESERVPSESGRVGSDDGYVIKQLESFGGETDAIWSVRKKDHLTTIVKDLPYLRWRYENFPDRQYFSFLVTKNDNPVGVFVVAEMALHGKRCAAIVEWLMPLENRDAVPAVIHFCENLARTHGSKKIVYYFRPDTEEYGYIRRAGYELEDAELNLSVAGPGLEADVTDDHLRDNWFFSLGDFDLV